MPLFALTVYAITSVILYYWAVRKAKPVKISFEYLIYLSVFLVWAIFFEINFKQKGLGNLFLEPIVISIIPVMYFEYIEFFEKHINRRSRIILMNLISSLLVYLITAIFPHYGDWP